MLPAPGDHVRQRFLGLRGGKLAGIDVRLRPRLAVEIGSRLATIGAHGLPFGRRRGHRGAHRNQAPEHEEAHDERLHLRARRVVDGRRDDRPTVREHFVAEAREPAALALAAAAAYSVEGRARRNTAYALVDGDDVTALGRAEAREGLARVDVGVLRGAGAVVGGEGHGRSFGLQEGEGGEAVQRRRPRLERNPSSRSSIAPMNARM